MCSLCKYKNKKKQFSHFYPLSTCNMPKKTKRNYPVIQTANISSIFLACMLSITCVCVCSAILFWFIVCFHYSLQLLLVQWNEQKLKQNWRRKNQQLCRLWHWFTWKQKYLAAPIYQPKYSFQWKITLLCYDFAKFAISLAIDWKLIANFEGIAKENVNIQYTAFHPPLSLLLFCHINAIGSYIQRYAMVILSNFG